jgi:hypothetical protein
MTFRSSIQIHFMARFLVQKCKVQDHKKFQRVAVELACDRVMPPRCKDVVNVATLNMVECDQAVMDISDHNNQSFFSSTIISYISELCTLESPSACKYIFADAVHRCDTFTPLHYWNLTGRTGSDIIGKSVPRSSTRDCSVSASSLISARSFAHRVHNQHDQN